MATLAGADIQQIAIAPNASNARRRRIVLLLTAAGAALGALSLLPTKPRLVWNHTASIPLGLYWISDDTPSRGDVVVVTPPPPVAHALQDAGVLRASHLLLKPLAAEAGDEVCRTGTRVTINGRLVASARTTARDGRALPAWSGCQVLGATDIFLIANHPGSFDSRYFGPLGADQIRGVAHPLLLIGAEQEPG